MSFSPSYNSDSTSGAGTSSNTIIYCPNPDCRLPFNNFENLCAHVSSSVCGEWLAGQEADSDHDIDSSDGESSDVDDTKAGPPGLDPNGTQERGPQDPTTSNGDIPPNSDLHGLFKFEHPRLLPKTPGGENLLQHIDRDKYAPERLNNIHYPFQSRGEWQLGQWLTNSSLTQAQIDSFLKLAAIKQNPPSFTSARDLRFRIENLPSVPSWNHTIITIPGYVTKDPMVLYWRDGLEVIKFIYSNPVFANCMDDRPYKLTDPQQGNQRVFGDFMSADFAWEYYDRLPKGHGMIGVIGASDKTPLTVGTGNREMHPVLLSIANIHPGVRMKATSHSFVLAGYLPIPKFKGVSPTVHAALVAQSYHTSLSIIVQNLRIAERDGVEMSDPNGFKCTMHTPLASWISDRPEMHSISCTLQNLSPTSLAGIHQFGDDQFLIPHGFRTREHTLNNIIQARLDAGPNGDLDMFVATAAAYGLLAVQDPFWATWGRAEPYLFLTPDALHAWHKFFFDHVVSWAIKMVGGPELDRRMASLQPLVGMRHWANGVSTLKQLTGREHRDLEKILVPCIAGAVTPNVLCSIRAMDEFIFQSQGILIYEEQIHAIIQALHEFHHFKVAIIKAGGRSGKNGPILHFNIPKLENMGMVPTSIRMMGAPYQFTSDITEHCHKSHVKTPYRQSNKRDHPQQMVRWMDRFEKARIFGLYTLLKSNSADLVNAVVQEATEATDPYPEAAWLVQVLPPDEFRMLASGNSRPTSLFSKAGHYHSNNRSIAFTLAQRQHHTLPVNEAARVFNLPDLRAAMGDYLMDQAGGLPRHNRRKSAKDCQLPFNTVKIWNSFRMQQHSQQDPRIMLPPRTIQALPVSTSMPYGRGNVVLVHDPNGISMSAESEPCKVVQIRMVFLPIVEMDAASTGRRPLVFFYGQSFKFSAQYRTTLDDGRTICVPEPGIDMFVVDRHMRADGARMGDIYKLTDIREILELVPRFGAEIPEGINCNNSLELMDSYYINNFSDKETFHTVLSYQ